MGILPRLHPLAQMSRTHPQARRQTPNQVHDPNKHPPGNRTQPRLRPISICRESPPQGQKSGLSQRSRLALYPGVRIASLRCCHVSSDVGCLAKPEFSQNAVKTGLVSDFPSPWCLRFPTINGTSPSVGRAPIHVFASPPKLRRPSFLSKWIGQESNLLLSRLTMAPLFATSFPMATQSITR